MRVREDSKNGNLDKSHAHTRARGLSQGRINAHSQAEELFEEAAKVVKPWPDKFVYSAGYALSKNPVLLTLVSAFDWPVPCVCSNINRFGGQP